MEGRSPQATTATSSPHPEPNAASRRKPARTTMLERVGWWVRLALWWLFVKVDFDARLRDQLRGISQRGPTVYVLQSRSLLDQLYFNYAFTQYSLPLARWSNGSSTLLLRPFFNMLATLFRGRPKARGSELLAETVRAGEPAMIFLEYPRASEKESLAFSLPHFEALARLQEEVELPIQFVPLLVVWERRSADFNPSLLDGLFGSRHSPGFFRKILYAIKNIWQPFFMMGRPLVQMGPVVTSPPSDGQTPTEAATQTRQALLQHTEQVRAVIVGPRFKRSTALKLEILNDPSFLMQIDEICEEDGVPRSKLLAESRKHLDKIAADFSMLSIKLLGAALTPIWSMIYDGLGVDQESIERVRQTAREKRIVLVPSHKSHIDYLILSYVFYQHGLIPPHIAAGDNLDFPPIGRLFRSAGAFFMRRSFRGDLVYGLCLQRYLGKLIKEGHPVEFFIEGGRSRTGKLLTPRFGLLRMIIDSFLQEPIDQLAIVPCAVTYERVIEASTYQKELLGREKKQENLGALLRSTSILTSRYGKLHVAFAEPIDVGEYLARYELGASSTSDDLQKLTQRLGFRVIHEINRAVAITPTALTSLVLLTSRSKDEITLDRLLQDAGFLLKIFIDKGVHFSHSIRAALAARRAHLHVPQSHHEASDAIHRVERSLNAEPNAIAIDAPQEPPTDPGDSREIERRLGRAVAELIQESIQLFTQHKLVKVRNIEAPSGSQTTYTIPDAAWGELSYYKNTILHTLVPEALLSTALLSTGASEMALEPLMQRTLFLSRLFKYEFVYEERAEFANVFWRTFKDFESKHLSRCELESDGLVTLPNDPTPEALSFFRDLASPFLESYRYAYAACLRSASSWCDERDFVKSLVVQGRVDLSNGHLRSVESIARPTLQNALRRMDDWGILETRRVERRRGHSKQLRLRPEAVVSGEALSVFEQLRDVMGAPVEPDAAEVSSDAAGSDQPSR